LAVSVFLWGSLLTFDVGDWPSPHQFPHNDPPANACGRAGAWLAYDLFYYLGDGAYPLVLFTTLAAATWLIRGRVVNLIQRLAGLALLVACTAAAVHLVSGARAGSLPEGNGGILGAALGDFVSENFSGLGAVVIIGYALLVGLLFAAEGWVLRIPAVFRRISRPAEGAVALAGAGAAVADRGGVENGAPSARSGTRSSSSQRADGAETVALVPAKRPEPKINPNRPTGPRRTAEDPHQPTLFDGAGSEGDVPQDSTAPPPPDMDQDETSGKVSPIIVKHFERQAPPPPAEPYPREIEDWVFPTPSLLDDPEYTFGAAQESVVRAKAKVLERTLQEFKLDSHVVEIDTGPVITMYELQLAPGIKVSQIASLSNDIARALKAPAVRVVAPIPGKNTIGIEVPNVEKEKVRLKELITMTGRKARDMALPLYIGKDASGAALVGDLATMPHLLIAGTTGSGKSVCINSIITSLLMTQRPDWCKLILVDPKMVEMAQFKDVPHLMCPIVTDLKRAECILEWAVTKMDERYEQLSEVGVRNIAAFNALEKQAIYDRLQPTTDEERNQIPTHMPHVVIVIDELADLMMTSAKEVEHYLSRLAQKSRAVGIHIVVATQRPEARVVTGLIKSNLPCRIAFRVASRMDSRIVLDQNGAEVLMGQGDMLFLPPGSAKLIRAQGTYLEDHELRDVIDFLKERAKPEFHPELIRMNSARTRSAAERDPLFDKAVRIVLETRRGSVSLLQRRLTIGYSRASRLIDEMAEAGIVGIYKGSQAREVNLTVDEWEGLQQQVAADLAEGYAADRDDGAPPSDEAVMDVR
jgi:S-DNA-T family DNA segregation ATPase FtsK/SpoIIIE